MKRIQNTIQNITDIEINKTNDLMTTNRKISFEYQSKDTKTELR